MLIEGELSLPALLRQLVEEAAALVDARYAALGVLDDSGQRLEQFVTTGLTPEQEGRIGPRPTGRGVLSRESDSSKRHRLAPGDRQRLCFSR